MAKTQFETLVKDKWYKTPAGSVVKFLSIDKQYAIFLNKYTGNKIEIPVGYHNKPCYQLKPASTEEVGSVKGYDVTAKEAKTKRRAEKKEQRKKRREEDKDLRKADKKEKSKKETRKAERKAKRETRPPRGKRGESITGKIRDLVSSFTTVDEVVKACKGVDKKRVRQVLRKVKRSGKLIEKGNKFKVQL